MDAFLGNSTVTMDTNQTTTVTTTTEEPKKPINIALWLFAEYLQIEICAGVALLGIVNNVLVIIVFAKMGYRETANISMTAIAIWNLLRCLASGFSPLAYICRSLLSDYYNAWRGFAYTITEEFIGYPAGFVSGCLSAFVAVERCVCVARPFLVKSWFTPRSVTIWCVAISVLVPLSNITRFIDSEESRFIMFNKTVHIGFRISPIGRISRVIGDFKLFLNQFYPFSTIFITSVCSIIIVYHLKRSARFRSGVKTAAGSSQLSPRDRQVVKMLVVVLFVYIACAMPTILLYLFELALPNWDELDHLRFLKYNKKVFPTFANLVDSSVNIYIFFSMSSQFNKTLRKLFCLPKKVK